MEALVPTRGLRHVALRVHEFARTRDFYRDVFGMKVVWEPDGDNVYLSSGNDNLALHRAEGRTAGSQALDHLGFFVDSPEGVQRAADRLRAHGVAIVHEPRRHRDGSWSLYCLDPEGTTVQILYDPNTNP